MGRHRILGDLFAVTTGEGSFTGRPAPKGSALLGHDEGMARLSRIMTERPLTEAEIKSNDRFNNGIVAWIAATMSLAVGLSFRDQPTQVPETTVEVQTKATDVEKEINKFTTESEDSRQFERMMIEFSDTALHAADDRALDPSALEIEKPDAIFDDSIHVPDLN